jgi:SAM-dependent methyltransferase
MPITYGSEVKDKTFSASIKVLMKNKKMEAVCSLCNNQLSIKLISDININKKIYNIFFCKECKVGCTIPVPSFQELSKLYSTGNYRTADGSRFIPAIESFIYLYQLLRKRRIKQYIKRGQILDIGCARGDFLNLMRNDGWLVKGVEFNKETASYAAETYGIEVLFGGLLECGFSAESFDVINISHVLEHCHKPREVIAECERLLRKRGLVIVRVPNMFSLQAVVGKRSWFHLDLPNHLYHFSEKGLMKLLIRESFSILKIRRFHIEHSPFGWLQTMLNVSGIRLNLLYDFLKSSELNRKKFDSADHRGLILTFVLMPLYMPMSFMLSVFESFILKKGGVIEIYAFKK